MEMNAADSWMWMLWGALLVITLAASVFSQRRAYAWFAGGFAVASLAAVLGAHWWEQALLAAVVGAGLVAVTTAPTSHRSHRPMPHDAATPPNVSDAIVGMSGSVATHIADDLTVTLANGMTWPATHVGPPQHALSPGDAVVVTAVHGTTCDVVALTKVRHA